MINSGVLSKSDLKKNIDLSLKTAQTEDGRSAKDVYKEEYNEYHETSQSSTKHDMGY